MTLLNGRRRQNHYAVTDQPGQDDSSRTAQATSNMSWKPPEESQPDWFSDVDPASGNSESNNTESRPLWQDILPDEMVSPRTTRPRSSSRMHNASSSRHRNIPRQTFHPTVRDMVGQGSHQPPFQTSHTGRGGLGRLIRSNDSPPTNGDAEVNETTPLPRESRLPLRVGSLSVPARHTGARAGPTTSSIISPLQASDAPPQQHSRCDQSQQVPRKPARRKAPKRGDAGNSDGENSPMDIEQSIVRIVLRYLMKISFGTFRLMFAKSSPKLLPKIRPDIQQNEALWLAVCREICELEAVGDYIPVSLFTGHGIHILVTQVNAIRNMRKIRIWSMASWIKNNRYINTQHDLFQRENDLTREEWKEAATWMIRWARNRKDTALVDYLTKHFQWLKDALSRPAYQLEFRDILDFDIKTRKKLHKTRHLPSSFSAKDYYANLIALLEQRKIPIPKELIQDKKQPPMQLKSQTQIPEGVITTQPTTVVHNPSFRQMYQHLKAIEKQLPSENKPAFSRIIPPPPPPRYFRSKRVDILFKIHTPYNVGGFERYLAEIPGLKEKYPLLIHKLRLGFPMGKFPIEGPPRTIIYPNGRSAEKNLKFIKDELEKEVDERRMDGPFSRRQVEEILGTNFICAPLTVDEHIQDDGSIKRRMCIDLSRPNGDFPSVNDYSKRDDFPTYYDNAKMVEGVIVHAAPGTQAMTLDIAKFHRRTPIAPGHKAWFVVQGRKDNFYIQHCCPFGARASEGNSGEIAQAMVDIWHYQRIGPILKWCDDLVVFRFPIKPTAVAEYSYTRQSALDLIKELNVPWHPDKGVDFTHEFPYIGLLWNIENKTVCLIPEKRKQYLQKVQAFSKQTQCDQDTASQISGMLSYAAAVYPLGRSYLPAIDVLIAKFGQKRPRSIAIPPEVKEDMEWWAEILSKSDYSKCFRPPPPASIKMTIATCNKGIGIRFNDRWASLTAKPDSPFIETAKDPVWLAGAAMYVALDLVVSGPVKARNCCIHIYCDNQQFVDAWTRGRHKNPEINLSIRLSGSLLEKKNIALELEYGEDHDALWMAGGKSQYDTRTYMSCKHLPSNLDEYLIPRPRGHR